MSINSNIKGNLEEKKIGYFLDFNSKKKKKIPKIPPKCVVLKKVYFSLL
jgi:tRNA U38,U39,U40 pseudouridine synthase TruA